LLETYSYLDSVPRNRVPFLNRIKKFLAIGLALGSESAACSQNDPQGRAGTAFYPQVISPVSVLPQRDGGGGRGTGNVLIMLLA
jgi:hypothetical protein